MNLGGIDLEELVLASKLVPTGCSKLPGKNFRDAEIGSTAAPSSAEQSPELPCMPSEAEAWPSLRESENGWDFCSEASDVEELWEDLPEPALAMEAGCEPPEDAKSTKWLFVPESRPTEPETVQTQNLGEEAPSKLTFADLLRHQHRGQLVDTPPPAAGTVFTAIRARHVQRPKSPNGTARDANEDEEIGSWSKEHKGWLKEHKGSWNTKQQRKVTAHKARQFLQSCGSRGWLEQEGGNGAQDEA